MESNPKKSKAFIITFIAVIILLITGYLLFSNKDQLFGTKASTSTNKNFAALDATPKNNPLTTIDGVNLGVDTKNTKVVAEAGEDISKCDAVYIAGVNKDGQPIVMKAIANDKKKSEVFGIATVDIPKGGTGTIATSGTVSGMPLSCVVGSSAENNNPLYLSDTVAGKMTTTAPVGKNSVSVIVGTALNVNAVKGTLDIALGNNKYLTVIAGENLGKGDSVYISGINANGTPIVMKADPNDPSKQNNIGITVDAIASGATGAVLLGAQKNANLVNVQGGQNITNGQNVYFSGTNKDGLPIAFVTIPSDPTKSVSVGTAFGDIPYFQLGTVLLNPTGATGGNAGTTNVNNGSSTGTNNGAGATFIDKIKNLADTVGTSIGNFFGSLFGGSSTTNTTSTGTSGGGLGSGTTTGGNGTNGTGGFNTNGTGNGSGTNSTGGFDTTNNGGGNGTNGTGGFDTTGGNGTSGTGTTGGFGVGAGSGTGGFGDGSGFGTGNFGTGDGFGTGGFGTGSGFGSGSGDGTFTPLPTPVGPGITTGPISTTPTDDTSTCTDADGNVVPCVNPTAPTVVSTAEMCPSDDPLVFTDDEKEQLDALFKKYYLLAPSLKSDQDIQVVLDDIAHNQQTIEQATSLIADCKAQKSDPNYTGPQSVRDNPYYKWTAPTTVVVTPIVTNPDPTNGVIDTNCDQNQQDQQQFDASAYFNDPSSYYSNLYGNNFNTQKPCKPLYGQGSGSTTTTTSTVSNPNAPNYLPGQISQYMSDVVNKRKGVPIDGSGYANYVKNGDGTTFTHHPVLDFGEFETLFHIW